MTADAEHDDQRQDGETRTRIDDLVRYLRRQVIMQWVAIGLLFLVVVVVAGSVGYVLGQQDSTLTTVNANRYAALVSICRSDNRESKGLRTFVQRTAPNLMPLARRTFPIERDCDGYARSLGATPSGDGDKIEEKGGG